MVSPTLDKEASSLVLSFPYDRGTVARVKGIIGARWRPDRKSWFLPNTKDVLRQIKRIFPTIEQVKVRQPGPAPQLDALMAAQEKKFLPDLRKVKVTDFKFATAPLQHQLVSFDFARTLNAAALFLEQGLGKAKLLIDLATWRFRKGQVKRCFVVCPASVIGQWGVEIRKHGHKDFQGVELLEGPSKIKLARLEELHSSNWEGFIVTNYEALLPLESRLLRWQESKNKLFDMMALDESTKIKHANSKRSKICWKLGRATAYRNILTGTPVTQGAEDIFGQYRFLNEGIFGPWVTAFRAEYLVMGGFEQRQVVGYRNTEQFLSKVYSAAIRFTKERCMDLPRKVYNVRSVRLDAAASKLYRGMERDAVVQFDGKPIAAPLVMTRHAKCAQLTGGFLYEQGPDGKRVATHRLPRNPKLEAVSDYLDEVLPNKCIIWCRFTEEINMVRELLAKRKVPHVMITGAVKMKDRPAAVAAFQDNEAIKVFLGQVATASHGITLTAASHVLYYSNDYSLENRLQSEDRNHRIGQTKSVTYTDLVVQTLKGGKTVDHDVKEVISGKNAFATAVSTALMARMATRHRDAVQQIEPKSRKKLQSTMAIQEEDWNEEEF